VAVFLRKEGAAAEDPEIAKLPPQAQTMVRQNLKEIESETDVARLQEGIARCSRWPARPRGDEAGRRPPPETGGGASPRPFEREEVMTERSRPGSPPSCSPSRGPFPGASPGDPLVPTSSRSSPSCSPRLRGDYRVVLANGMWPTWPRTRRCPGQHRDHGADGQLPGAPGQGRAASFTVPRSPGGSVSLTAEELDERFDFLAARPPPASATGIGQPQLPGRQPRRGAQAVRGDVEGAALPGGPPGPGPRAGAPGHEEAQRRLGRHRDARVNVLQNGETHFTNRFTTEASVKAITATTSRLPPALLPSRQHDCRGVRRSARRR